MQEAEQGCDELEDDEECQSRPKLPAEQGPPPLTAGALTYQFPSAAHSAWSQRLHAGPSHAHGKAQPPSPPAREPGPSKQVWPAQLQPRLAGFLLPGASDVHTAEVRCGTCCFFLYALLRACSANDAAGDTGQQAELRPG